jgi:hypothetical protein
MGLLNIFKHETKGQKIMREASEYAKKAQEEADERARIKKEGK